MSGVPEFYFEGPEKVLEVWFEPMTERVPSPSSLSSSPSSFSSSPRSDDGIVMKHDGKHPLGRIGLRAIPRSKIVDLLDTVKVTILSDMSNEWMDSYVLSESSLFVTPYRLLLKTCGTSILLAALPPLMALARDHGLQIQDLFFSRKNLGQPSLQHHPHTTFQDEISYIEQLYKGSAFTFGKVNDESWFLYTLDGTPGLPRPSPRADTTLEVLMTGLDEEAMAVYYKAKNGGISAREVTKASGIGDLFPGAQIDESLFDPCGYSMNGLVGEHYFTIHVTPQKEFSFVSFETDVPVEDYEALVCRVLAVFKPASFSVVLFSNTDDVMMRHQGSFRKDFNGFTRTNKHLCCLDAYQLAFSHFVLPDTPALSGELPLITSFPL